MTRPRGRWRAPLLLAALVVAVHAWELNGPFVFDDLAYIGANPAVQRGLSGDWWRFFTDRTAYSAVSSTVHYRPLVAFSYAVNAQMGLGTFGFKLTEVALHVLAALGLLWALGLARRHRPSLPRAVPFVAAAWVGVAPFNVEAVHYLSARSALLCGVFAAWALGLHLAMRLAERPGRAAGLYVAHLACLAAALLSKETALTLPAAMLAADLLLVRGGAAPLGLTLRRLLWPYAPYAVGLGAALVWMPNVNRAFDYLGQVWHSEWRLATAFRCLVENLRLMLLPTGLTPVHPVDTGARLADAPTLAALAVVAGLLAWAWRARRRAPLLTFGLAWYFLLIAPSTFVHLNVILLENRGYTASFGVGMVVAWLACRLWEAAAGRRRAVAAALACAVLLLGGLAVHRERAWGDPVRLWDAAVRGDPASAGARTNRGLAYLDAGRPAEAEADLRWAVAHDPEIPAARYGLVAALLTRQRYTDALAALEPLREWAADDPRMWFELARTYLGLGRDADALEALRRLARAEAANARVRRYAYRYAPGATATEIVRVALRAGRLEDARWAVAHLRRVAPEDPQAEYLAFRVALAAGDRDGAAGALERLARRLPGDPRLGPLRAELEAVRRGTGLPPPPP